MRDTETVAIPPLEYLTAFETKHKIFSMNHCLSVNIVSHIFFDISVNSTLTFDCKSVTHFIGISISFLRFIVSIFATSLIP